MDLRKAYDSVDWTKMIEAVRKRCKDEMDHHLVDLIDQLHRE